MADIKDVAQAVRSALEEIGVNGELNVRMDGDQKVATVGKPSGDDLSVQVEVSDLDGKQKKPG